MQAQWWQGAVRPQRIRTYLVLFALAITIPLLGLAVFALNRMAAVESAQIERWVVQTAQDLASDVDRELDRAFVTLETLATSSDLQRGDLRAFHAQALLALRGTKAAIVLIDRSYQQLVDTLKEYGAALPKTGDPQTAQRVIDTKQRQVSNLFRGSISGRPVFNVEVPILDAAGEVRHVLIMSFQATHIADLLRKQQLEAPWITGITDNNGIILARSERHDDFVGKPLPRELLEQSRTAAGVFRATNVAGDPILRATVRSEPLRLAGVRDGSPVPRGRTTKAKPPVRRAAPWHRADPRGAARLHVRQADGAAAGCSDAGGRIGRTRRACGTGALGARRSKRSHGDVGQRVIRVEAARRAFRFPHARTRAPGEEPAGRRQGNGVANGTTKQERSRIHRAIRSAHSGAGEVARRAGPAKLEGCAAERARPRASGPVRFAGPCHDFGSGVVSRFDRRAEHRLCTARARDQCVEAWRAFDTERPRVRHLERA